MSDPGKGFTESVSLESVSPESTRHEWVSFEYDDATYLFDATFLMSNWTCIFGQGCKGVLAEDATELQQGCCSHGAHFADAGDRRRVRASAARLTKDQWQLRGVARRAGGPLVRSEDGDWTTRIQDGACIFLNRPDFARGAGCALHVGAVDAGESFLDWKPEVCWQLPLRLTHHVDEVQHTTWTLREWKRRDWGEGGEEFHWWCTESPDAFVGAETVVVTLRDEIVALVGEPVYDELLEALDLSASTTWVPHPAVRRR
ncbi:MAG: hypothetical protein ACYC2O_00860 [Microthrixaceae bacterium]